MLVPAGDGRGTNAAFRRPANLFPLRFGDDSFKPHHAAAQATGKPCIVLNLPGIAVDVDNPEDLHQLISLPGTTRSQTFSQRAFIPNRKFVPRLIFLKLLPMKLKNAARWEGAFDAEFTVLHCSPGAAPLSHPRSSP